ncbi:MAG TPA: enoyl-CoA hydratase/isomerase family protein [Ilumatobacteraceae bacterium]|nr:enoyl-CoA hydratase/isomerase family protein [Ilumatobacteraceae bacterium]
MNQPSVLIERLPVDKQSTAVAAVVTLNRPDQLNPIDAQMLVELDAAWDAIEADRTVRAVLITGAGRAFSAGGDLKKYIELQRDRPAFTTFVDDLHRCFGRLITMRVPVVALVNGVTAAGGLELILNCDFAIAAASARIGDGHLNFGQMGGGGVLTMLPRLIGRAKAVELMLSGRLLPAEEACAWGLVSRVVPDDELLDAGLSFAAEVAAKSPLAVANAKTVLNQLWAENGSIADGLRVELERDVEYCLTSHDAPEGLAAFAERRPPRFTGR